VSDRIDRLPKIVRRWAGRKGGREGSREGGREKGKGGRKGGNFRKIHIECLICISKRGKWTLGPGRERNGGKEGEREGGREGGTDGRTWMVEQSGIDVHTP
jgi:hypothetical protein